MITKKIKNIIYTALEIIRIIKSLINVVNGIGGCLGLAVGASLLTLVELLVMVSKLFTSALKEFCSPRTSDNVQKLQY